MQTPWAVKLVVKDRHVVNVKKEPEDSVVAPWKEAEKQSVKQSKTKAKSEMMHRHVKIKIEPEDSDDHVQSRVKRERDSQTEDSDDDARPRVKRERETEDSDDDTGSRVKRERETEDSDNEARWVASAGKTKKKVPTNPDPKEMSSLNTDNRSHSQDVGAQNTYHQEEREYDKSTRWICPQNYAAMEASAKNFGLIPMGVDKGVRTLIMHVPKGKTAWEVFQNVQPGCTLQVVKGRKGGKNWKRLGVRFTSPARYFPPGVKVSCLTIGVDDTEWQSLMTKPRRI